MERFEQNTGPRLTETDPEVLEALKEKITEISKADGSFDSVNERDIGQAAFHAALMAEREGKPFTMEMLDQLSDGMHDTLTDSLAQRVKDKPAAGGMHVIDSTGTVIGSAGSRAEAQNIIDREREATEPHDVP